MKDNGNRILWPEAVIWAVTRAIGLAGIVIGTILFIHTLVA